MSRVVRTLEPPGGGRGGKGAPHREVTVLVAAVPMMGLEKGSEQRPTHDFQPEPDPSSATDLPLLNMPGLAQPFPSVGYVGRREVPLCLPSTPEHSPAQPGPFQLLPKAHASSCLFQFLQMLVRSGTLAGPGLIYGSGLEGA